ncbi:MAG: hypothetical protein RL685_2298 [Pseudomonadota bacterium]|jgi:hypothetical protein
MNLKDLYTYRQVSPLSYTNPTTNVSTQYGTAIISYEVRRYPDLRNLGEAFVYKVVCTQRIVIPNQAPYVPGGANIASFENYPAIAACQIGLASAPAGQTPSLVNYSPRTINSSVVTSVSHSVNNSNSSSFQHTTGSSSSQSNSFGASASIGFFGDLPTGGVSLSYDHTWGSESSKSNSTGAEAARGAQQGSDDSMTVKDWACYTYLDVNDTSPTWIWGQEYPWNIIQFRNNSGTANISLPQYVQSLLTDTMQLFPPSELSQFGIDFTMKAAWLASSTNQLLATHTFNYYTASHQLNGKSVNAQINGPFALPVPTISLDLCAYGLDPILGSGAARVAVAGFIPRQFLTLPVPAQWNSGTNTLTSPTPFLIISSTNNLMIQDTTQYSGLTQADAGAGFVPSETALTAVFTPRCTSLTMLLSFKVVDAIQDYRLFFKHWKTGSTGVMLTIVINDSTKPITKYVDALEAEGGEDNLLAISLRNLDFGSADYHDYLQLGFNTISITITPIGGSPADCGYQIRAISIER